MKEKTGGGQVTQAIKEVVALLFYLMIHAQHFPLEALYKRGRLKVEDFMKKEYEEG